MTFEQALALLKGDSDALREKAFSVVKCICAEVSRDRDSSRAHELVLRALEKRHALRDYEQILNSAIREVGLYPYLDPSLLGTADLFAYEYHRPEGIDGLVFHRAQAQVYRELAEGHNVILSAPTSFGKSLVVDAVIARGQHANIAVILPTIALVDETRRRLARRFGGTYRILTHPVQSAGDRNIYVSTQERISSFDRIGDVTLYVVDEFYKLSANDGAFDDRAVVLNAVVYRALRSGAQFYLLGPNIHEIPEGLPERFSCRFIKTDYSTVIVEQHRVPKKPNPKEALLRLCRSLLKNDEPTIVYCASPARVREVAEWLVVEQVTPPDPRLSDAANWVRKEFHADWSFASALERGVGVHHGRLPRSLSQYVVRQFNDEVIPVLVCTSTLIEGVNTRAKNVVIFDNKIAHAKLDYFTYSNIRGRSGRMFHHFVGHVWVFDDPPTADLPFVDFPAITQGSDVPPSVLLQVDQGDLTSDSYRRLEPFLHQQDLSIEVLRANVAIDPDAQLAIAREIRADLQRWYPLLAWSGYPQWNQLVETCVLLWNNLWSGAANRGHIVRSGRQLAYRIKQLKEMGVRGFIGRVVHDAKVSPDECVEGCLSFVRNWAGHSIPSGYRALERIQASVFGGLGLSVGDYSYFVMGVENAFVEPAFAALEEYGVPVQVSERVFGSLEDKSLDGLLLRLKQMSELAHDDLVRWGLDSFEADMLLDAARNV